MNEISYQYKPKLIVGILALLFFGLYGVFLFHKAKNNVARLIINGIFELTENSATNFYFCLSWGSGIIAALGTLIMIINLTSKKEINLLRPKNSFLSTTHSIPFLRSGLEEQLVYNQLFLKKIHTTGKISVPQSMFKNKTTFNNFIDTLSSKIQCTQLDQKITIPTSRQKS